MKPTFIPLWPGARGDRVISATTEAGEKAGAPVAATSNLGRIRLRATGEPNLTDGLDVVLQTGGNVRGYADRFHSAPGATVRVKPQTGSDWYGYTSPVYVQHAALIELASTTEDYPGVSTPRTVADGRIGMVRMIRDAGLFGTVEYLRKHHTRYAWTALADVAINADPTSSPALLSLPSGRLLCYYVRSDYVVIAMYSDDDGASWGSWSADTLIDLGGADYYLSAELVGDEIVIVASKQPGSASDDAYVYWSFDRGQSFGLTATETWGPARTCVTKTGVVLCITTDQATASAVLYYIPPGGGPGLMTTTGFSMGMDADDGVGALVTMDDGTIWALTGGTSAPAPLLTAQYSRDHGKTWLNPYSATSGTSTIWRMGINEATPYGLRSISVGEWRGSIVVLGSSQASTADYGDTLTELYLGGWDTMTERDLAGELSDPCGLGGSGAYVLPVDTPTVLGWTSTVTGAGATLTLADDGWKFVATGTDNTLWTASTYFAPTSSTTSWRMRYLFKVEADGSIADDRSIVRFRPRSGSGPDFAGIRIRHSTDQIRVLDHSSTLATTVSVAGKFNDLTEVVAFVDAASLKLSVYYRIVRGSGAAEPFTALVENATIASNAGTPTPPAVGGADAGAVTWYVSPIELSLGDMGYAEGFTSPGDLCGRALESAYDVYAHGGYRLGAAAGGGVVGDTYASEIDATYSREWIWRDLRPSAQHRSTGDNTTHAVVFDAGASNVISADWIGLVGTNFRTARWDMHTSDSWTSPSVSVNLDATLYAGAVAAIKSGLGYVGVDGAPWVPHQWRSRDGARVFVEVGGVAYEVDDSDEDRLYVEGVDFSAASGTLYVYGDRMAARLPGVARYRYARALVTAQQTADDDYRIGTVWPGIAEPLSIVYAPGFVWSDTDAVQEAAGTAGYAVRFELGPMRRELRIAWDPIDRLTSPQVAWLRNLFRALAGRLRPVVFGDLDSRTDWGLYTITGPLAVENVTGEERDALERVSQLVLRQVL